MEEEELGDGCGLLLELLLLLQLLLLLLFCGEGANAKTSSGTRLEVSLSMTAVSEPLLRFFTCDGDDLSAPPSPQPLPSSEVPPPVTVPEPPPPPGEACGGVGHDVFGDVAADFSADMLGFPPVLATMSPLPDKCFGDEMPCLGLLMCFGLAECAGECLGLALAPR